MVNSIWCAFHKPARRTCLDSRVIRPGSENAPMTATDRINRIISEGPLGPAGIAKLCGSYRENKPTHPSTVARWMIQGVRIADGRRIHLEHIRIAGRLVSSQAALLRFLEQQQLAHDPSEELPRTRKQRDRVDAQTQAQLREMGIE